MIEASAGFVCAADEVWRLQRGSEEDCLFFQRAVNGGKRITDRGTRQGTWIFAPSGKLLAHTNTRNVQQHLQAMAKGLAAFEALAPEDLVLPDGVELEPAHRWEHSFPADGLALERIGREVALEAGGTRLSQPPSDRWNRDFAWFSAQELRALVPDGLEPGDTFELPLVARRLARFHLVDNVRGQTLPFADEEVEQAALTATVTACSGNGVELRLEGATRAVAADHWLLGDNLWTPGRVDPHGIRCELLGRATWDPGTPSFRSFDLVAVGRRWGRTAMNGRGQDAAPGLVAFHLSRTERRIAPTFIAVYDVDWVSPPEVPTWRESPAECGIETE